MDMVDRGVIVIHPRQPFVDWLNRTVEQSPPVTMEELEDDCSVLLVPEQDSIDLRSWISSPGRSSRSAAGCLPTGQVVSMKGS